MKPFKYIFFLCIIFAHSLYAQFEVSYLDDKVHYHNIDEVIGKKFTPTTVKKTFGIKKHLWLKVDIKNTVQEVKENYLALSNLHILEDVHFYTVMDGKVVQKDISWNKYTNVDTPHRVGKSLFYQNTLNPKQSIEVYIYITAKSNIYIELYNGTFSEVLSATSKSLLILIIVTGMLLALGIYYLFLWLLTPNKEYFYYIFFVFSMLIWGFYINGGYAYYFDNYIIGPYVNTFIYLLPLWIMLFFKAIYPKGSISKKIHIIFNSLITIIAFIVFIYFMGLTPYFPHLSVATYGTGVYLISLVTILIVAIIMYKNKVQYSGYFLLGFSVNFVGSIISILFFLGFISYNIISSHAVMLGGVFEAILFSILLTAKLKEIYKQKDEAINTSKMKDLKIQTMNDTISFISHQWRQPLSQINSAVLIIDDELYIKNIQSGAIEEKLNEIESMTKYMSKTIDDFKNLYSGNSEEKKLLSLYKPIEKAISTLSNSFQSNGIKLDLDIDQSLGFYGIENDVQQIMLVLLNNARDALVLNEIQNPKISIILKKLDQDIMIEVCDNAKGIPSDIIEKIFDPHFTTKENTKGSGIGLYMAKLIIEDKFKGNISVYNDAQGACFCIKLNSQGVKLGE